jgi:cell wall-associated NlpC family hydrolase
MHKRKNLATVALFACGGLLLLAFPGPARADGVYFVKEGDTLPRVSQIFGVKAGRLREVNGIGAEGIKPGDRLRIPDQDVAASFRPATEGEAAEGRPSLSRKVVCQVETVTHTIAKGETLAILARRYRTPLDELLRLNRLKKTSRLSIGQVVVVKDTSPRSYTVRPGDTLARIATRTGVGREQLRRLNQLDTDRLAPGQKLLLEACEEFTLSGSRPAAADTHESAEMLTAIAEATAEASLEASDLQQSPASVAPPPTAGTAVAAEPGITERLIGMAKTMLNIPYRFGGTTMRGIDCSAYVQRVFGLLDINLPRTAREQFSVGQVISRDELTVGDLVFFRTYAKFPSHVGIYLGDSRFIHASSVGKKVTIDRLDGRYYTKRFLGGRRLLDEKAENRQITAGMK